MVGRMNTEQTTQSSARAPQSQRERIAANAPLTSTPTKPIAETASRPISQATPSPRPNTGAVMPSVLYTKDLPGPLSLHLLSAFGTVHQLDETAGYWSDYDGTLYGRASIIAELTPYATTSCSSTAAWVWLGGAFPDAFDVISNSHFRSTIAGRRIRVFKRRVQSDQVAKLANLSITTPTRTACDLVMMPDFIADLIAMRDLVEALMTAYRFTPSDCLAIVKQNRYHKFAARARLFFETMQREHAAAAPPMPNASVAADSAPTASMALASMTNDPVPSTSAPSDPLSTADAWGVTA